MANIKITAQNEIYDGMPITFRAPCDSAVVEGLKVCSANVTQTFTLRDAHGTALTRLKNLFSAGAYVTAILDTTNGHAYIQNGDTNTYLEGRLKSIENGMPSVNIDATLSAEGAAADAKAVGDALAAMRQAPSAIDFSDWEACSFMVQMPDGTTTEGSVEFDDEERPKSITLNGHTLTITLPVKAVE